MMPVQDVYNLLLSYSVRKWEQTFCKEHPEYEIEDPSVLKLENPVYNDILDFPAHYSAYPYSVKELKEQLLPFPHTPLDIPEEIEEEADNGFVTIPYAFSVPELIPMLKEGWIDENMLSFYTDGDGRLCLELIYLPHTKYAISPDPQEVDFGNQPDSFGVFIWDENGYADIHSYLKFYKELRAFGLFLQKRIEAYRMREKEGIAA